MSCRFSFEASRILRLTLLFAFASIGNSPASKAAIVFNVDFGLAALGPSATDGSTAMGVIGQPGHTWNNVVANLNWVGFNNAGSLESAANGGSASNSRLLVDSNNSSAFGLMIGLSNANNSNARFNVSNANLPTNLFVANNAQSLMRDYLNVTNPNTMTMVLNGLQAGYNYELYLYGAGDAANQGSLFTVTGVGSQSTAAESTNPSLTLNQDYVVFSFDGSLSSRTVSIASNGSTIHAPFNGFQLQATAVPEPSSLALLGITGVVGYCYRRQRWKIA